MNLTQEQRATLCAADASRGWESIDVAGCPSRILNKLVEYRACIAGLVNQATTSFRSMRSLLNYHAPEKKYVPIVPLHKPSEPTFEARLAAVEEEMARQKLEEFRKAKHFVEVRNAEGKVIEIIVDYDAERAAETTGSNRSYAILRGEEGCLYRGITDPCR